MKMTMWEVTAPQLLLASPTAAIITLAGAAWEASLAVLTLLSLLPLTLLHLNRHFRTVACALWCGLPRLCRWDWFEACVLHCGQVWLCQGEWQWW
ncbi:hypothetical protein V8C86DRAFT_2629018 [Haematococcus lacustris]